MTTRSTGFYFHAHNSPCVFLRIPHFSLPPLTPRLILLRIIWGKWLRLTRKEYSLSLAPPPTPAFFLLFWNYSSHVCHHSMSAICDLFDYSSMYIYILHCLALRFHNLYISISILGIKLGVLQESCMVDRTPYIFFYYGV